MAQLCPHLEKYSAGGSHTVTEDEEQELTVTVSKHHDPSQNQQQHQQLGQGQVQGQGDLGTRPGDEEGVSVLPVSLAVPLLLLRFCPSSLVSLSRPLPINNHR